VPGAASCRLPAWPDRASWLRELPRAQPLHVAVHVAMHHALRLSNPAVREYDQQKGVILPIIMNVRKLSRLKALNTG
jgi:hypothetical protein